MADGIGWAIILLLLCACGAAAVIYKKRMNQRQAFYQAQSSHYSYMQTQQKVPDV